MVAVEVMTRAVNMGQELREHDLPLADYGERDPFVMVVETCEHEPACLIFLVQESPLVMKDEACAHVKSKARHVCCS